MPGELLLAEFLSSSQFSPVITVPCPWCWYWAEDRVCSFRCLIEGSATGLNSSSIGVSENRRCFLVLHCPGFVLFDCFDLVEVDTPDAIWLSRHQRVSDNDCVGALQGWQVEVFSTSSLGAKPDIQQGMVACIWTGINNLFQGGKIKEGRGISVLVSDALRCID